MIISKQIRGVWLTLLCFCDDSRLRSKNFFKKVKLFLFMTVEIIINKYWWLKTPQPVGPQIWQETTTIDC